MDSICKEIDSEDVRATTLCILPAAMDSAPTPMQLLQCKSEVNQFQTQETKQDLQVQEEELIEEIEVEDVGTMTPCGLSAAMDSASTPNVTSPMKLLNQSIPNPRNPARSAQLGGGADILIPYTRKLILRM